MNNINVLSNIGQYLKVFIYSNMLLYQYFFIFKIDIKGCFLIDSH